METTNILGSIRRCHQRVDELSRRLTDHRAEVQQRLRSCGEDDAYLQWNLHRVQILVDEQSACLTRLDNIPDNSSSTLKHQEAIRALQSEQMQTRADIARVTENLTAINEAYNTDRQMMAHLQQSITSYIQRLQNLETDATHGTIENGRAIFLSSPSVPATLKNPRDRVCSGHDNASGLRHGLDPYSISCQPIGGVWNSTTNSGLLDKTAFQLTEDGAEWASEGLVHDLQNLCSRLRAVQLSQSDMLSIMQQLVQIQCFVLGKSESNPVEKPTVDDEDSICVASKVRNDSHSRATAMMRNEPIPLPKRSGNMRSKLAQRTLRPHNSRSEGRKNTSLSASRHQGATSSPLPKRQKYSRDDLTINGTSKLSFR